MPAAKVDASKKASDDGLPLGLCRVHCNVIRYNAPYLRRWLAWVSDVFTALYLKDTMHSPLYLR